MKRINVLFLGIILAVAAVFTVSMRTAFAVPPLFQVGVVAGVVSAPGGGPSVGANISVLCNGNTLNTTTDGSGLYEVSFTGGVCEAGQNVTVTASKGGLTGIKNGTMQANGQAGYVKIDVAIVNIPLVPEFGLITGAMTFLASGGVLFLIKKRD